LKNECIKFIVTTYHHRIKWYLLLNMEMSSREEMKKSMMKMKND
jgi:hypothetical protein